MPVQLHIVHDLGGGVDRWCRDYCNEDRSRVNLVLKPVFLGNCFGSGLVLYADAGSTVPIRFWPFNSAIKVIDVEHSEYRQAISEIVRDCAVDGVIVSSLIGHSLDALDTGLPTLLVTHDYFPACPAINAYYGSPCTFCDASRLADCAEHNPRDYNPFADLSIADRQAVRTRFLELLVQPNVTIVYPTNITRERWQALFPQIASLRSSVIGHGYNNRLPHLEIADPEQAERLRIVVLGSLTAPKGFHLIQQAIAHMTETADVFLVGSGNLGLFLSDLPHVEILDGYMPKDLPAIVSEIRPHLALLPSVCPETYSYVLSELNAMGIPVMATEVGAFIERIRDGETGYLFEPTPKALIECLTTIDHDRHKLASVKTAVMMLEERTVREMVADYHRTFPLEPVPGAARLTESDTIPIEWACRTVPDIAKISLEQHQLRQRVEIQALLLKERQTVLAEQRATLGEQQFAIAKMGEQHEELSAALLARQRQIDTLHLQLSARSEQLAATEHRLTGVLHSTSWVVTRPLRAAAMLVRGQHGPLLIGLRHYLARWGRRAYWHLPLRWRQPLVGLAYRLAGPLFKGLPDYQRWLARRVDIGQGVIGTDMVDIDTVAPVSAPPAGNIAIHAHVFYADLAEEFAKYLDHMPFDYDLFVSVPDESVRETCAQALAMLPHQRAFTLQIVPNRGRDIAPMFCTFGAQLKTYSFVAHIHTKKSLYNKGRTTGWREYLLDGLLGSPEHIRRVFALLAGPDKIGMVYPQTHATVPYQAHTWLANRIEGEKWCHQLGIAKAPSGYFDFPAGSMFWARTDALRPLFDAGLTLENFPPETGQIDGTFAHTLERLLGVVPFNSGWSLAVLRDQAQPSWSRWRVDQFFNRTADGMFERLTAPNVSLVVFDIFDTLLTRPLLDPEHIKQIVAARVGGKTAEIYLAERAMVEHQARQRAGRDVCLDDIYREWLGAQSLTPQELTTLRSAEEAVELTAVSGRTDAILLLKRVAATGKRIVLASDTFLSLSLIESMLARHDVVGWKHLYLSGEVGLRKDTGELYRHLLIEERVAPEAVLMVGDNERSDVQIPGDIGCSLMHVLRSTEIARAMPRWRKLMEISSSHDELHWSVGLGIIFRHRFQGLFYPTLAPANMANSAQEIGYAIVGPLIVSFAQWLARHATEDGVDRLYFLAREGQILHRVYEALRRLTGEGPESHYLVVSRRAVTVPLLEGADDIRELAKTHFFPNTLAMFLFERYGLTITDGDIADYEQLGLWKAGELVEVRGKNTEHLKPLLDYLEPRILAKAQAEKPALLEYLKSVGCGQGDRVAVVDVGYSATIQGRLNRLLGNPVDGYYMISNETATAVASSTDTTVRGCFGEDLPMFSGEPGLYRHSFILEKLLSSNERQVLCYRLDEEEDGQIRAVPQLREFCPEEDATRSIRDEIQAGALAFVDDVLTVRKDLLPDFVFPPELASDLFDALMTNTSADELNILRGIVLDDYYCGRGLVS